jgi:hypothetical protein
VCGGGVDPTVRCANDVAGQQLDLPSNEWFIRTAYPTACEQDILMCGYAAAQPER